MQGNKLRAWHKADRKMYEVYGFSNGKWFLKGKTFPMPGMAVEITKFVGLTDCNDEDLFEGDITALDLDGDTRYFKVAIKTGIRELVPHPSFSGEAVKVEITAVVFEWNGFDLLPCVDANGVADNKRMKKVGNVFENPELLTR